MGMNVTEILAPDGSTIYIQYDEDEVVDTLTAKGGPEMDIAQRTEKFREMIRSTVGGYAQLLLETLKASTDIPAPEKVSLEFGLQLGGETGIPFIAKGTAQANVKVSLEWVTGKTKEG
ncbi:MAG: CU044_2847 family protein [Thermodesulfovibrionales bacterium]|jgi:hypothetical protein